MADPTPQLHQFHLLLCRYAADHVAEHLSNLRVRDEDQLKYAGLFEYLKHINSQGRMVGPDMSELLLNDDEFAVLHSWAENLEVTADGKPVPTSQVPKWEPMFHRRAVDCFQELKDELKEWAEKWLSDSKQFADQLEKDELSIASGVGIVRDWAIEVRRYLNAMGKDAFIPLPDGDYPTPTTIGRSRKPESKVERYLERLSATSSQKQYNTVMDEALETCMDEDVRQLAGHERIVSFVESMRWAIQSGGDASGDKLIKRVDTFNKSHPHEMKAASRTVCFLALRILESLGEHTPGENKAKRYK